MDNTNWIGTVATIAIALGTVAAVIVAYFQLGKVNFSLRMQNLSALLQLEQEINVRRADVFEISNPIIDENQKPKKDQDRRLFELLERRLESQTEAYLNAVDRLSFCILSDYLPEWEWRAEYREFVATTIRAHKSFFEPGTRFTNIVKLHDLWSDT